MEMYDISVNIGSGNAFSQVKRQTIMRTIADYLSTWPLGTIFSET